MPSYLLSSSDFRKRTTTRLFTLDIGTTYTLSFDYSNNGSTPNSMTWGIGAFTDTLVATTGAVGTYFNTSITFQGDGSTAPIVFDHAGGDNAGIVIDNIHLEISLKIIS